MVPIVHPHTVSFAPHELPGLGGNLPLLGMDLGDAPCSGGHACLQERRLRGTPCCQGKGGMQQARPTWEYTKLTTSEGGSVPPRTVSEGGTRGKKYLVSRCRQGTRLPAVTYDGRQSNLS